MYKHKQCLVALVCVLVAGKDCAGTLPRAAERFKTRLAAATAGCQVVVYTTLFYPPGVRLPLERLILPRSRFSHVKTGIHRGI